MRFLPVAIGLAIAALSLAGCRNTPEENVEAKTERTARGLEQRYNQIESEAANGAETAAAPYDNEADLMLNQMPGNTATATASNAAKRR
jgi:hypothetical protein